MRNTLPITKNLLIINIIVFLAALVAEKYGFSGLVDQLSLHFIWASDFHFYQLFTYMFLHAGWWHLFFNMFALWMFGSIIEHVFGGKRFLIFYIVCGIGAGITQEVWQLVQYYVQGYGDFSLVNTPSGVIPMSHYLNAWSTVGASGACFGVLLAYGMYFPNQTIMLLIPPIPIKAKYFVIGYIALELYQGISGSGGNIAHFAHLGGMLFGWLLILYWRNQGKGTGSGSYGRKQKNTYRFFFEKLKQHFRLSSRKEQSNVTFKDRKADYTYNAQQRQQETALDTILAKVKRSGYESLSVEEKKKLFEQSHPKK